MQEPLQVQWEAPDECPDGAEVLDRAAGQLDDSEPPDQVLAVHGVVEQVEEAWTLRLAVGSPEELERGGGDRRVIEGESCEALTDAAALVIALRWIGGAEPAAEVGAEAEAEADELVADAPADEETPPESEPIPERREPPPRVEPVLRERPAPTLALMLGVRGGLALGVLPGLGGAAGLDAGLQGRAWRVAVAGRVVPVRFADHPGDAMVSGRFDLATGGALGCGIPSVRRLAFPLCAGLEVGGLRGVGRGQVTRPQPRWSVWAGATASVSAAWRALRWLSPMLAAEGVLGLTRPGFTVGTVSGTLYEAQRVGLRVWAGLEFQFDFGTQKPEAGETHL